MSASGGSERRSPGRYAGKSYLAGGMRLAGRARAVAVRALGCAVAALILLVLALTAGPTTASGATLTLTAAADAYVRSDQAATNFGSAVQLASNGSSTTTMISYLRFDVTGLSGPATSATLSYYSQSTGVTKTAVHLVSGSWSESTLTYGSRPAYGATISTTGALTAGTRATADVSSVVTGNGSYSFALTTTATATRWADSREAANPPQLLVTENTVTPTPTATTASPTPSDSATPSDSVTPSDTVTTATSESTAASTTDASSTSAAGTDSATPTPSDTSSSAATATTAPATTAATTTAPATTAPTTTAAPPTSTTPILTTPAWPLRVVSTSASITRTVTPHPAAHIGQMLGFHSATPGTTSSSGTKRIS